MKTILVASYYFPPCNIISAQRAQSFADNFSRHGLYPIIVTRHWEGTENSTSGYESENLKPPVVTENEKYTLIQLPYPAQLKGRVSELLIRSRFGKLLLYATLYARGTINPKCNADKAFYPFVAEYLKKTPVDFILATVFPMNTIKLASRLSKQFGPKLIVDFRDLWDNELLSETYRPRFSARIQNFFYEFYLRRWLENAELITMVSDPLGNHIQRIAPKTRTAVITNGFERHVFADARKNFALGKDKFRFSVIGTLEPKLDLTVMIKGLNLFLQGKDLDRIQLSFVGTAAFPEIKSMLENALPSRCTRITERIPREKAIRAMVESHVLFHAGWRGFRGMASGKIYEYLGAGRNILIAPNDHDVM
ncbi:MAG TPA: hypothetical protein VJL58_08560, partial [Pyrinomonadaceae bacterium]|nr:hypothetical protein [Pyrinomonadaceae bacterium]